jgi:Flp pilus assembly pilin Flp
MVRLWLKQLVTDQRGTTTAEYGLVMAFIVLATLGSITLLGLAIDGWYDELTARFLDAMT